MRAFWDSFFQKRKLTIAYKNGASKAKSLCIFSHSFKTKSDILKNSRHALRKVLFYLFEQVVFSRNLFLARKINANTKCDLVPAIAHEQY